MNFFFDLGIGFGAVIDSERGIIFLRVSLQNKKKVDLGLHWVNSATVPVQDLFYRRKVRYWGKCVINPIAGREYIKCIPVLPHGEF